MAKNASCVELQWQRPGTNGSDLVQFVLAVAVLDPGQGYGALSEAEGKGERGGDASSGPGGDLDLGCKLTGTQAPDGANHTCGLPAAPVAAARAVWQCPFADAVAVTWDPRYIDSSLDSDSELCPPAPLPPSLVAVAVPGPPAHMLYMLPVSGDTLQLKLSSLRPHAALAVAVRARNGVGVGPWSRWSEAMRADGAPGALAGIACVRSATARLQTSRASRR